MNTSMIRYILGNILKLQALFLLLPSITALIYREDTFTTYIIVAFSCLIVGLMMTWKKPEDHVFYLKEGCVATALSWIVLSLSGAFPFVLTGEIPHFIDALFGKVDFPCCAGIDLLFGDSILILGKIQFSLIGASDNQNHAIPSSDQCINSNRTKFCDA